MIWIVLPLFLLLATVGGYLLTAHTLAPLQSMAAQAQRISGANLDQRLDIVPCNGGGDIVQPLDRHIDALRDPPGRRVP